MLKRGCENVVGFSLCKSEQVGSPLYMEIASSLCVGSFSSSGFYAICNFVNINNVVL